MDFCCHTYKLVYKLFFDKYQSHETLCAKISMNFNENYIFVPTDVLEEAQEATNKLN